MTSLADTRVRAATRSRPRGLSWLDRPLTSYYLILGSSGLLLALGLVMVLSASSVQAYATSGSSFAIVAKQATWVAIGLPLLGVASRLSPQFYRRLGNPLIVICGLGLLAVLVPHVGATVNGSRRWIALPGGLDAQPSEFAKLALVLWGAELLTRKERLLEDWRHLVMPLVPVALFFALLVLAEPDMGTAIVIITLMLALLWTVGAPGRIFGVTFVGFGGMLGLMAVAAPYRLARLTSFLDPFAHPQSTGYQAVQGLYAVASGGWWGVGLGASREKWAYLPNQYTDYIFAIIGEELGLVGSAVVLLLFALLTYGGFRVACRAEDRFVQLAAAGVTAWLASQAIVNVGYVAGVLPVTGIPLPMVSFGGSALVPTLVAVGMLASFARHEPAAAAALAARRAARDARSAGNEQG